MASAFNQYSLLLLAIGILAVAAFFLFRKGLRHQEIIAFLVIFAGLFVAWLALHPTQTPLSSAATEVQIADRGRQTCAA